MIGRFYFAADKKKSRQIICLQYQKSTSALFISPLRQSRNAYPWLKMIAAFFSLTPISGEVLWQHSWTMFNMVKLPHDANIFDTRWPLSANTYAQVHTYEERFGEGRVGGFDCPVSLSVRAAPDRVSTECWWEGQRGNSRPRVQITNSPRRWCVQLRRAPEALHTERRGICHVNEWTNDTERERDSGAEKTQIEMPRFRVSIKKSREFRAGGPGLQHQTTRLHKDVQFSSLRSQNYYCLADAVCVNIK